ncbi:MAG: sulfotransferase [Parvibaculum sp.]|nr:sulfotransferase [Parvibaculum sp.]
MDNSGKTYFLVGGCPRSGTTLLASMLGASPECVAPPESDFVIPLARALKAGQVAPTVDAMRAFISGHWRFRFWNVTLGNHRLDVTDHDNIWAIYAAVIFDVVDHYARAQGKPDWKVWIDHRPDNIRWVSFLNKVFLSSEFVHVVRDGRAVAHSVIPLDWGANDVLTAADFWTSRTAYGLAAETTLTGHVHRMRYEDIVERPEVELQRLCKSTGLGYCPAMLLGGGSEVPVYTRAQHALVGQGVQSSRKDIWKTHFTARQVEIFENKAGWLLEQLAYDCDRAMIAKGPSFSERAHSRIVAQFLTVRINRYRGKLRQARGLAAPQ